MSYSKNRHQAQRWLQTAEEDVHAAQVLLAGGMRPSLLLRPAER